LGNSFGWVFSLGFSLAILNARKRWYGLTWRRRRFSLSPSPVDIFAQLFFLEEFMEYAAWSEGDFDYSWIREPMNVLPSGALRPSILMS